MSDLNSIAQTAIGKELEHVKKLKETAERLRHPVLKALLEGIAKDSEKHSLFYQAIVDFLNRVSPMLTEEELESLKASIEKHLEIEAKMIQLTKEWSEKVEDPRLKMILWAIHEDEVKHHILLEDIRDKIAKRETFTEDNFWDAVWKDSPWHGTPGG
ncbi:MAG: ferritin-like domain-containing protein [Thermoprotei archaeon]|nr:MAG: ferritin-like domain-containing protein [Thermoprotei archaeon]